MIRHTSPNMDTICMFYKLQQIISIFLPRFDLIVYAKFTLINLDIFHKHYSNAYFSNWKILFVLAEFPVSIFLENYSNASNVGGKPLKIKSFHKSISDACLHPILTESFNLF
jgi:hypothetical protein